MRNFHFLTIFLLALSSNLDNVGVGVSYGVRRINIPFASNLLMAIITGAGTFISMLIGAGITRVVDQTYASAVGAIIIGATGVWVFVQEFSNRDEDATNVGQILKDTNFANQSIFMKMLTILDHPFLADTDFSGHISLKEGLLLAFALTLNNLSNGIGAGLLGLNRESTTFCVTVLSILTIWFGIHFGRYSGVHWFGRFSGGFRG
ncbi:MAG: sporulation membrane protein YtaF [Desulfomonilaceae bacterium]